MAINTTFTSGAILTAAQMNALPWGIAARATSTSSHTCTTTESDIAGLTVTFTAISTRYYKTTIYIPYIDFVGQSTTALLLADGSNTILQRMGEAEAINFRTFGFLQFVETGLSGSITRKARTDADSNSQTYNPPAGFGSGTMIILVEDIGST